MSGKQVQSQRVFMPRTKAIIVALIGTFAFLVNVPAAQAATGDKHSGCTSGGGCELIVGTNACTKTSAMWTAPPEELTYKMDIWFMVNANCTVRLRNRVVSGSGYAVTAWKTYKNTTSKAKYDVAFELDARKRCFTEFSVKRKDGSWYTRYHYNTNYLNNKTFREKCSDA